MSDERNFAGYTLAELEKLCMEKASDPLNNVKITSYRSAATAALPFLIARLRQLQGGRAMQESDIKADIRKLLDSYAPRVYYEMWVPSGYGKTGLDFNVCAAGRALYIEAKRPRRYATARQRDAMRNAYLAGAACFIISNGEGVAALAGWLRKHVP